LPSPRDEPRTSDITQPTVTPEQQAKIKALAGAASGAASSVRLSAGATLPSGIQLHDLPAEIGLGGYRYAHVGGQIVIVDPDTNTIIQAF
jgi:hypothetical protein